MLWVIVIIGVIIYIVIKKKKEKEKEHQAAVRNIMEEIEKEKRLQLQKENQERNREKICSSQEFNELKKVWIWMSLAGGTNPLLHPQIYFEDNNKVTFIKRGYDLPTHNLNQYYTGSIWEEREKALNRFEEELFGEFAGKLGISIEYIADHLIQLERRSDYSSNFTLSISIVVSSELCQDIEVRKWIKEELWNIPVIAS